MAQWVRCCATNLKVAGSISDGIIGIFRWHNPPDRTMALGSTQPLTEMSTRRISCVVNAAGAYGWQPYHLPVPLPWNVGTSTSRNPLGHSRPVTGMIHLFITLIRPQDIYRDNFTFYFHMSMWWKWNVNSDLLILVPDFLKNKAVKMTSKGKYLSQSNDIAFLANRHDINVRKDRQVKDVNSTTIRAKRKEK